MVTENSTETVNDSTEETSGQAVENEGNEENATSETEENGNSTESNNTQQDQRLPDTHPLVKAYASSQAELKSLKASHQAKVSELEEQVTQLKDKGTNAEQVQAKYDRLEAFLSNVGGPLSKALDSRSFTKALFESDKDIKEIVSQWHRDNPSATSSALNSGPGTNNSGSKDMNSLLRSAIK